MNTNEWYIIVVRIGNGSWLTQNPTRYQNNPKRFAVFGPYNLASARAQLYGGLTHA